MKVCNLISKPHSSFPSQQIHTQINEVQRNAKERLKIVFFFFFRVFVFVSFCFWQLCERRTAVLTSVIGKENSIGLIVNLQENPAILSTPRSLGIGRRKSCRVTLPERKMCFQVQMILQQVFASLKNSQPTVIENRKPCAYHCRLFQPCIAEIAHTDMKDPWSSPIVILVERRSSSRIQGTFCSQEAPRC